MSSVVFDIETVGRNFDGFDDLTKKELLKRLAELEPGTEEYLAKETEIRNGLGLSPLTGEIVALGLYDCDKRQGMVLYQAPGEQNAPTTENNITYIQKDEAEMLQIFWQKAKEYDEFVSFFGRGFDAPWLAIRSAIHKILPSKDLMSGRYLYQQKGSCRHVDLADQFTFYGSYNLPAKSLHMYCQAFGITSPKSNDVTGATLPEAYRNKRYLDIARYNGEDLVATCQLYDYWNSYLRF